MKKIRVGVIFGGRSGEHEVSLRSAESILKSIDRSKYDVVPIGITHEGRWLASKNAIALLPAKDAIQKTLTTGEAIVFPAEPAARGVVDVVFPILHGTFGEDGTIQGLLELANVPYVGAGVLGSAVGMDKDVMKRLLRDAGLPVVDYWTVRQSEIDSFAETRFSGLPYPVFVKPANLGSSVGITKVHGPDELRAALKTEPDLDGADASLGRAYRALGDAGVGDRCAHYAKALFHARKADAFRMNPAISDLIDKVERNRRGCSAP